MRILDAALEIAATEGTRRVNHRSVASQAGVPLGSVTYYFPTADRLVVEMFRHLSTTRVVPMADLSEPMTRSQLVDRITSIVVGESRVSSFYQTLSYEMVVYGYSHPDVAALASEWHDRWRAALAVNMSPDSARTVVALIDGWLLQDGVEKVPLTVEVVRSQVEAVLVGLEGPAPDDKS
ncbi:TetR family transcriptional regulator [Saccharopolyspora karakumensis]|uniref:TetR family transcriptional regulator n=1 Tax=Saccharopolyspora karakumensis TaxID=2530386 RepID=A0A4R5BAY3_9PSEU|nr:TetR family transcriptional regulator [Saccharopolyspora karakumensis]TDD80904.1 TetR family transcriptional regulator [Saccharopolyspora karakumensis]